MATGPKIGSSREAPKTDPEMGDSLGAPVEAFVRLIRGRYKPDILIHLGKGRFRFSELRRAIPRVSERVLARQLDELERDGLIHRTAYPEIPPRVEYCLTQLGTTLCPIIKQIWKWGGYSTPLVRTSSPIAFPLTLMSATATTVCSCEDWP
jgi:DNA-binding HxlR family transcriptional regulator